MTALIRLLDKVMFDSKTCCWNYTGCLNHKGYGLFGHDNRVSRAHRFSYSHFNGPIPSGMQVCHKCDNRKCVNPSHLFVGTPSDNTKDMLHKKREARGRLLPQTKLSELQVLEIRESRDSQYSIARRYGISQQTVSEIKLYKIWKGYQT